MLSQNTVTKFLSSAAVNMNKEEYASVKATLKAIPGLEEIVTEAAGVVRTKAKNKIVRKIHAMENAMYFCSEAAAATERAINSHRNAIFVYEDKIAVSRNAIDRRNDRVRMLLSKKHDLSQAKIQLNTELEAFDSED